MDVLDLFSERLELIKEHESWIEYICPLCKNNGLKINKNTGYYKNYKCNCDTKRISAYVFINSTEYRKQRKPREVLVVIPEIPNVLGVKLCPIQNPCYLRTLQSLYSDLEAKIYYYYSDTQRTLRVNRIKSTGKKIIFPQVQTDNGWVNGIGDKLFPIYSDYINEYSRINREYLKGELIIVVEGEKCVQYLNSQNVEAISILSSYSNSVEKIKLVLEFSKDFIPNVRQFLYIPDLDAVGIKKAITFQQATWSLGIPTKIFDIRAELVKSFNFVRGYDIADYIVENNNTNLVEVFENEFR